MNRNRNLGGLGAVARRPGPGGKGLLGDAPMSTPMSAPMVQHRGMGLLGNAPQNMGTNTGNMGANRQNMSQPMYNQRRTGLLQQPQQSGGGNPVMQQQVMIRDNQLQMVNNLLKRQTMSSNTNMMGSGNTNMMGSGNNNMMGSGSNNMMGSGNNNMMGSGNNNMMGSGNMNMMGSGNMNMMQSNINPMPGNPLLGNYPSRSIPSLLNMNSGTKRPVGPGSGPDPKRMRHQLPSPIGSQRMNRRPEQNSYDRRDRDRDNSIRDNRRKDSYSPDSDLNKRGRRDSDSALKDSKKVGSEEYDPAEPTEEGTKEKDEAMAEKGEAGSGLTVTFDRKGRSVNQEMGRKRNDSEGDKKKTNYFCHACNMECFTQQSFTNHMKGQKHKNRMEELLNLHQQKSTQLAARMKAQEHLRKIEGKDSRKKEFCRICAADFTGTFLQHKQTREHKNKARWHSHDKDDGDEEFFPEDLGDLVTVDTVGFEDVHSGSDDDTDKEKDFQGMASQSDDQSSPNVQARQGWRSLRSNAGSGPIVIPDYDPDLPVGQNYVIPVSGFFCKLCHKFYNNETAAKITHCQSQSHYEKFQKSMLAKVLHRKMKQQAVTSSGDVINSDQSEISKEVTATNGDINGQPSLSETSASEPTANTEVESIKDETKEEHSVETEALKSDPLAVKEEFPDETEADSPEMIELLDAEELPEKLDDDDEDADTAEPEAEEEEEIEVDVVTTAKGRGRGSTRGRSKRGRRGRK